MTIRLLPTSLFGRLITALLAAVGTTAVIVVVLVARERQELAFRGSQTAGLISLIAETSRALAELPADARTEELERLTTEGLLIQRGARPPGRRFERNFPRESRALAARLGRTLGGDYRVRVNRASPGPDDAILIEREGRRGRVDASNEAKGERDDDIAVSLSAENRVANTQNDGDGRRPPRRGEGPDGRDRENFDFWGPLFDVVVTLPDSESVTYRTSLPPPDPPPPRQIFVQLGLLTGVLAVVLFLMARTITRPLSELASAAEAVGRGTRVSPLRETGAREIREATRAFNTMQERLHRYLDSRTRVLRAMSHDFRTPLTRLKLRVEALDDEKLRERFTADLDEMNDMVTGALNLFRGIDDEPAQPVDIGAMLEQLKTEFGDMNASVTMSGEARGPIVAKPNALKRCLTNLISNAVKYGERATVVVDDRESELVLRVLDDGPGIPADALDRVFEPFFRLENSRNSDTGGVGLGLSIARDIAQAHGGSLVLRNRSPHGLEASLTLPRTESAS